MKKKLLLLTTLSLLLLQLGIGQTQIETSPIFYKNGRVGIGTNNPLTLFHISETFNVGNKWNSSLTTAGITGTDARVDIVSWGSGISLKQVNSSTLLFENSWDIRRQSNIGGGGNGSLSFSYGTNNEFSANSALLTILTNGNVGVGTTSPTNGKLHIEGSIYSSNDIWVNKNYARIKLGNQGSDGDVHIGSSGNGTPGAQDYGYYIAHNAYRAEDGLWHHSRHNTIPAIRSTGNAGVASGLRGFYWDYSDNSGSGAITWTNLMKLTTDGKLGIGRNPQHKLDVAGIRAERSYCRNCSTSS